LSRIPDSQLSAFFPLLIFGFNWLSDSCWSNLYCTYFSPLFLDLINFFIENMLLHTEEFILRKLWGIF
jgi:hypothetical protein